MTVEVLSERGWNIRNGKRKGRVRTASEAEGQCAEVWSTEARRKMCF